MRKMGMNGGNFKTGRLARRHLSPSPSPTKGGEHRVGFYHNICLERQICIQAFKENRLSTTLSVNIEIDYGNGTMEWHNETQAPAGQTLFGIMQNIAVINYSYYAFTEPGHVLIDSINNVTKYTDPSYVSGYSWIWYYYSDSAKMWLNGPVGCDAWLLKNDGVYKWSYELWSYP